MQSIVISANGVPDGSRGLHFCYEGPQITRISSLNGMQPEELLLRHGSWAGLVLPEKIVAGEYRIDIETRSGEPVSILAATCGLVPDDFRSTRPGISQDAPFVEKKSSASARGLLLINLPICSIRRLEGLPLKIATMFWYLDAHTAGPLYREWRLGLRIDSREPITPVEVAYRDQLSLAVLKGLGGLAARRYESNSLQPPLNLRREVAYLSEIMLTVLQEHMYPAPLHEWTRDGLFSTALPQAFYEFAGGVHTIVHRSNSIEARADYFVTDGGPNSPFYLLFAEFALTAYKLRINPEAWSALLPVLVGSQQTYRSAYLYPPEGATTKGKLTYKQALANHDTGPRVDEGIKSISLEQLKECSIPKIEERHSQNLTNFFSEKFGGQVERDDAS